MEDNIGKIDKQDVRLLHMAHEAWNVLAVLELKLREGDD